MNVLYGKYLPLKILRGISNLVFSNNHYTYIRCGLNFEDFQNIYNFEKHDFIGEVEFNLHEIVTAKD